MNNQYYNGQMPQFPQYPYYGQSVNQKKHAKKDNVNLLSLEIILFLYIVLSLMFNTFYMIDYDPNYGGLYLFVAPFSIGFSIILPFVSLILSIIDLYSDKKGLKIAQLVLNIISIPIVIYAFKIYGKGLIIVLPVIYLSLSIGIIIYLLVKITKK